MDKEIMEFAKMMQVELSNNSSKGDWKEFKEINNILLELEWHKAKLFMALKDNDKNKIREYIADCANNLMFLSNATNTLENNG
jgi:hypothetical protein